MYGELVRELANGYVKGRNKYPKDLAAAHKLLVEYRPPRKPDKKKNGQGAGGANQDESTDTERITESSEAHTFTQVATEPETTVTEAISFMQVEKVRHLLKPTDVLLDSQSNVNVGCWTDLIQNIVKINGA